MIPTPPTKITSVCYNNRIDISWIKNPETDIQGYNIYNSTTSGGGLSGYVKLNNFLIETYSEVKKEIVSSEEVVEQSGNTRKIIINEVFREDYIFTYSHENLAEKQKQFYVVTAVNSIGEESVSSLEIEATPLSIPTEIVEITTRTENDIALDYITELLERDPELDVKPGSVIRQLHVDPNSYEMSLAFIREDFAMRAQSFLSLRKLDDEDDDGVSDPVSDSKYKLKLKQAFFFENDSDVQELIDDAFESLAANYNKTRQGAIKASTTVTFYSSSIPSTDIKVLFGQEVSTVPTESQNAIKFKTLSSDTMFIDQIENYYNPVTQLYELNIPVEAIEPGIIGNVNANTIINTNISGLSVTNKVSAFGGEDEESNSDLSDRCLLSFVGLDVGTVGGYKRTCSEIQNVRDVKVICAGDSLMQRDYDEVRKKHIFGKVDIYIRGGERTQSEDKFGFLYNQVKDEIFQIIDLDKFLIKTDNERVTSKTQIYSLMNIRNISKGKSYDILGNWSIIKNNIVLEKRTQVSLNLETGEMIFMSPLNVGDVIFANYQYKNEVLNESLISPANGGEVNFSLEHFPIVKRSYEVYKNDILLSEETDYNIILDNGFLQLTSGLNTGDVLYVNYKYIKTVINESVISSAVGGETTANLLNSNILESVLIGLDGYSLELDKGNEINSSVGMTITDLISVTYRYRDSEPILLLTQPAEKIISVIGSLSGTLQENVNFVLNKTDDILLEGNSSKAHRTLKIKYSNGIPLGDTTHSSETIVLINNEYKELSSYGVDPETIIVRKNENVFLRNNDYLILPEQNGKKVQLARSRNSSIPNGEQIEVSYNSGEILTVVYEANPLIKKVQDVVDISRHVTADVLVKQVLETKIDFEISVILLKNSDPLKALSDIRTAISNEINKLKLGEGIAQSDIIRAIELVSNVKSVVVPLTKMIKADGTQVNREIITSEFNLFQNNVVPSYSTGANALFNKTKGHLEKDGFYAIFEDDIPLTLVSDINEVDTASGQGFITENGEIILSTINNDLPSYHKYSVSYVISGETGTKDIEITDLEFLSVGEILITTVNAL